MPDPTGPSTGALGNLIGKGGFAGANVGGGLANQVRRIADRATGRDRGTGEGQAAFEGLLAYPASVGSATSNEAAIDLQEQLPDRELALALYVTATVEAEYAEPALVRREWTMSVTDGLTNPRVYRPQTVGIDPAETITDTFGVASFWFPNGGPDEITVTFNIPGATSWFGGVGVRGIV